MAAKKKAAAEQSTNAFDDRRETLVVELKTTWREVNVPEPQRDALAGKLHADPKVASKLEYVRCPTGFVRHITVTADDLNRLGHKV